MYRTGPGTDLGKTLKKLCWQEKEKKGETRPQAVGPTTVAALDISKAAAPGTLF